MKIGFTGTQHGMTSRQKAELQFWLRNIADGQSFSKDNLQLHHGGCIGADKEAHDIWLALGYEERHPHVHWAHGPGIDEKRAVLSEINDCQTYDAKPPLERNRDIVDVCAVLIAAPLQRAEVLRSGTWATVRYARTTGKTVLTIWP